MHLLIDITGAKRDAFTRETVEAFLRRMPETIAMTPITEPMVRKDGDTIVGVVVIAESHISVHAYPAQGVGFVDIFSCKVFDRRKARAAVRQAFGGVASWQVLNRGLEVLEN